MNHNDALISQQPSPLTPDYSLQIPVHLRYVLGVGLIIGLFGLVLTIGGPDSLRPIAYVLLALGVLTGVVALLLNVVTGNRYRLQARRAMLDPISWRGDEKVLDVGCGNGFFMLEAAKHLTSGKATGIDVWKADAGHQTVQLAERNAQIEGVADHVEVRNIDARQMPFEHNSFDVILSGLMLHHAGSDEDRRQVVQEMIRVVKPGGAILLYDMQPFIAAAAKQLQTNGFRQVKESGMFPMRVLTATKAG